MICRSATGGRNWRIVASAGARSGCSRAASDGSINWHWIFFVNVPIGIATGAAAVRLIAADEGLGLEHGADVPGALIITAH